MDSATEKREKKLEHIKNVAILSAKLKNTHAANAAEDDSAQTAVHQWLPPVACNLSIPLWKPYYYQHLNNVDVLIL